jgi:hypothetical protein
MTSNETEVEMEWVNVYFALRHAVIIVSADAPEGWQENEDCWDEVIEEASKTLKDQDGIDLAKHNYSAEIREDG